VQPRLGSFVERLDELLEETAKRPERERLTARRLYGLLQGEGYTGAYDSIQRHARDWRRDHGKTAAVFVPLWFALGEAYKFDWSHEIVVLGGATTEIKVAHVRLCHSRMAFLRAYPRETQEMVFDAHDHAFRFSAAFASAAFTTTCARRLMRYLPGRRGGSIAVSCSYAHII
jgi:transposase